jgi:hypothetical protein
VVGAGSAEVFDLNGFSDAECAVYSREKQRVKYSGHPRYQAVAISE